MTTTIAQSLAADAAFWQAKWNGTDAQGTGTTLTADYVLFRNMGKQSVASVKLNDEDASGAVSSNNSQMESGDGYDASGNKLQWFPENQGEAQFRVDAAIANPGLTISSSGTNGGQLMLDVALREIDWPFKQMLNKYYGTNAMVDTSVAAGAHKLTIVTATGVGSENFGGVPSILGGYTPPQHTIGFWLAPACASLYRLVTSSGYNASAAPTNLDGYATYGAYMTAMAQKVHDILLWLDFGGTANYYAAGPVSDGHGGYVPSAFKIANDNAEAQDTHRRWNNAAMHFAAYQFCKAAGRTDCDWMEWFGEQSVLLAAEAQQVAAPTINTTGGPLLGLRDYYPEQPQRDGQGMDTSYGGASLAYGSTAYAFCNNRALADGVIAPSLNRAFPVYASRVDSTGNVSEYLNTRCDEYVEENTASPYYGLNTGQPQILLSGTQNIVSNPAATDPYVFGYPDESNTAHNVGTPKSFAYQPFAQGFLQWGSYQLTLAGADSQGYRLIGSSVYGNRNHNYTAPVAAGATVLMISAADVSAISQAVAAVTPSTSEIAQAVAAVLPSPLTVQQLQAADAAALQANPYPTGAAIAAAVVAALPAASTPVTLAQIEQAVEAELAANPAPSSSAIAAAVVSALPQSSGSGQQLTVQQITAAFQSVVASLLTPVSAPMPPCSISSSSFVATVGDVGRTISDTLFDENNVPIDLSQVTAVQFVADTSEGASAKIGGSGVVSGTQASYTFTPADLAADQDYAWVRWICTMASGQVTAQGSRWRSVSVQASP